MPGQQPPTPIDRATRECVRQVFMSIGYDIDNREDVRKLADILRWSCEQREKQERSSTSHQAALWSVVSALLGGLAVSVGELFRGLFSGGH